VHVTEAVEDVRDNAGIKLRANLSDQGVVHYLPPTCAPVRRSSPA
jgi:hypothetical protein